MNFNIPNVLFVSSTNNHFNKDLQGLIGRLNSSGNTIHFTYGSIFNGEYMHTSYVTDISILDNLITVNTRNSQYIWKSLDPTPDYSWAKPIDELNSLEAKCKYTDSLIADGTIFY